jgi:DNA-binding HxlR family transcriptional regulator
MVTRRATRTYNCSVELALECLSGKWKPSIMYHLKGGPKRFAELRRLMPSISKKVLAAQLRDLESDRIVQRNSLPHKVPPGAEYRLSEEAGDLRPVLRRLHEWGMQQAKRRRITFGTEA